MKRRKFLTYSIGALAGVAGPGRSSAAKPCPPSIHGAPATRPCPLPITVIQAAADDLAEGASVALSPNPEQSSQDIQWMISTVYFDPIRNQIQYMGKSATGQTQNHWFTHYIYDCHDDEWTEPHKPAFRGVQNSSGHIWCHAFDPIEGNYYCMEYRQTNVYKFTPATVTTASKWTNLSSGANVEGSGESLKDGSGAPIFGWHPNLFGPGLPGLWAMSHSGQQFAYNPATNLWKLCQTDTPANPIKRRNNGQTVYIPETYQLAIFGQHSDGDDPTMWLDAGGGSATNVVAEGYLTVSSNQPPCIISGKGSGVAFGQVVNHPDNPNRLLLIQRDNGGAVYDSTDYGNTWVLRTSGSHPNRYKHDFDSMDSASSTTAFTCGSLPLQRCVMAISSSGGGGEIRIWKPGL